MIFPKIFFVKFKSLNLLLENDISLSPSIRLIKKKDMVKIGGLVTFFAAKCHFFSQMTFEYILNFIIKIIFRQKFL